MPVISRFLGIVIAMYWDDHRITGKGVVEKKLRIPSTHWNDSCFFT